MSARPNDTTASEDNVTVEAVETTATEVAVEIIDIATPTPAGVIGAAAATGRRKEAVARVRIAPGTGKIVVNGRPLEVHFPNKLHQQMVKSPLVELGVLDSYDVIARIDGGGVAGQAGAMRMGIARALNDIDRDANRAALKKAGFLTRDARVKERRKAGLKKARKAPQYTKR